MQIGDTKQKIHWRYQFEENSDRIFAILHYRYIKKKRLSAQNRKLVYFMMENTLDQENMCTAFTGDFNAEIHQKEACESSILMFGVEQRNES